MPYEYYFNATRVIDGDTVDGFIDLGFSVHRKIRVRMAGIDAPESRTRDAEEKIKGLAAKQRLEEMIANAEILVIKSLGVGKYGRCIGILYDADNEDPTKWKNINQSLITEGFATEYVK